MTGLQEDRAGRLLMTVLAAIAYFVALGAALYSDDKQSAAILEGMGGGFMGLAVGYWLGSSSGSKRKDEQLAESSDKKDQLLASSVPVNGVPLSAKPPHQ
jgi:hypothetical protein